jgi:hypothetical protein
MKAIIMLELLSFIIVVPIKRCLWLAYTNHGWERPTPRLEITNLIRKVPSSEDPINAKKILKMFVCGN